ncbi:DUF3667 domain-containing protein [Porphyrobacter sp. GA68]|uniref:DUF3667 domain-containing protein n=1 Tax=Porphyrobacter sp. GA68 TaxID=2883480 RepID=UPI001D180A69|nr:DUF3667 domain-containing protein [Porphyrobacter sp. GA68]
MASAELADAHLAFDGESSTAGPAPSPDAAAYPAKRPTQRVCLNCQAQLVGDFCHVCGQHAHVHRTLAAFGHDLLHGVLHLEGKVWRTLPKLLFRPGELTRRYIAGERARFVSPLALFLFSVFLMFALMNFVGAAPTALGGPVHEDVRAGLQDELSGIETRVSQLRRERDQAAAQGLSTARLDEEIRDAETGIAVIRRLMGEEAGAAEGEVLVQPGGITAEKPPSAPGADVTRRVTLEGTYATVLGFQAGSALDVAYRAARDNPKLLLYKLQTNAYKFSWMLILISVPFVALLFLWRWRPLYDHTVFVTYSITAVSILIIMAWLLMLAGVSSGVLIAAGALFVPWHMYRQLRGGYQLRRFSALWRTALLIVFASCALALFALGLLMLGVMG